ncbi:MAG: prolipoprotein diacylglyceryl transferase [Clostridia bacterium]|nr:prolipoprotein diacylglyceryl transferase [Clostridia bacterium]
MFGFYSKHFTIFGLDIAYYGLIIAVGMALGVFVAVKNAKYRGLKGEDIILLACYVLPLAIIGARIYYVLFSLDKFTSFWQVFEIWKGGMAIYGGVIGGAIGVALYCLIHKKNFLDVADVVVPALILGQAIGRWGNFFNQEAYGYYIENQSLRFFPFGVYIDDCNQMGCTCAGSGWHYATFFYESMWNLATFAILMFLLRKEKLRYRGSTMALYFIIYGVGRSWIEALRTDSLYIGALRVSQFLSILLILFGIAFIATSHILYKKGKAKSLQQLKPYYQQKLQNGKADIKIEIPKDEQNDKKDQ